jgi:hypothetical protein
MTISFIENGEKWGRFVITNLPHFSTVPKKNPVIPSASEESPAD